LDLQKVDDQSCLAMNSIALGHDISAYDPAGPLPEIPESNASKSGRDRVVRLAARENLSILALARRVCGYLSNHNGALPLALQMGLPALNAFPRKLWTRLAGRQLRQAGVEGLVYPDPRGHAPLRATIASYLGISRGITCRPEQVFVCAGYRACLDLISYTLMHPSDRCWLEEPG
jgi:DNA-binding transcriptional MocR family regulator